MAIQNSTARDVIQQLSDKFLSGLNFKEIELSYGSKFFFLYILSLCSFGTIEESKS